MTKLILESYGHAGYNVSSSRTISVATQRAAPYVIDGAEDDVAVNDMLRIDVDGVHTTPAEGLIVTMGFN